MDYTSRAVFTVFLWQNIFLLSLVNLARTQPSSHVEHEIHRRASVIGTFRFERLHARTRGKNGWNVSGCYCPASSGLCDCSRSSSQVKMFVDQQKRQKSPNKVRYRSRMRSGSGIKTTTIRVRSGCFCDSSGCRGSACKGLNGCVCNRRNKCWGSKCPTISNDRSGEIELDKIGYSDELQDLGFLMPTNNLSGLHFDGLKDLKDGNGYEQIPLEAKIDGCLCESRGCQGSLCDDMNGCFCSPLKCWGKYCSSRNGQERELKKDGTSKIKIGESLPTFNGRSYGKDILNGKISLISDKFESLGSKKEGLISAQVSMVNGKLGKLKANGIGPHSQGFEGYPINLAGGIEFENVKGKNMDTISTNDVHTLKHLTGKSIPVLKGYEIDSIVGYPVEKIEGIEISSYPAEPLKKIVGQPIDKIFGQQVAKIPANPMKKTVGQHAEKIFGFPIKSMQRNPVQKLSGMLMGTIAQSPVHAIMAKPVTVVNSNGPIQTVPTRDWNTFNSAEHFNAAQSLREFLNRRTQNEGSAFSSA